MYNMMYVHGQLDLSVLVSGHSVQRPTRRHITHYLYEFVPRKPLRFSAICARSSIFKLYSIHILTLYLHAIYIYRYLFHQHLCMVYFIPVNLSDPHGRRSPAIQNEKAGD